MNTVGFTNKTSISIAYACNGPEGTPPAGRVLDPIKMAAVLASVQQALVTAAAHAGAGAPVRPSWVSATSSGDVQHPPSQLPEFKLRGGLELPPIGLGCGYN